jgi:hypothetical protein
MGLEGHAGDETECRNEKRGREKGARACMQVSKFSVCGFGVERSELFGVEGPAFEGRGAGRGHVGGMLGKPVGEEYMLGLGDGLGDEEHPRGRIWVGEGDVRGGRGRYGSRGGAGRGHVADGVGRVTGEGHMGGELGGGELRWRVRVGERNMRRLGGVGGA